MDLYWIDAFTDRPFAGNPAAVVPLDAWLPDGRMQHIAFENGLAETAFLVHAGPAAFHLRWFTPTIEVDLCGHATLASAHVLWRERGETAERIGFETRGGALSATRLDDGRMELDFPATPPAATTDDATRAAVTAALGTAPTWLGRSKFDHFAVLSDASAVRTLRPDAARVAAAGARGLIVTAPGEGETDFVSRFFAPQSGVPEDPVTGSAHCALAPYWAARLGRTHLHARQVSARGGELWCELRGDRVGIAGRAVTYLRGKLNV